MCAFSPSALFPESQAMWDHEEPHFQNKDYSPDGANLPSSGVLLFSIWHCISLYHHSPMVHPPQYLCQIWHHSSLYVIMDQVLDTIKGLDFSRQYTWIIISCKHFSEYLLWSEIFARWQVSCSDWLRMVLWLITKGVTTVFQMKDECVPNTIRPK